MSRCTTVRDLGGGARWRDCEKIAMVCTYSQWRRLHGVQIIKFEGGALGFALLSFEKHIALFYVSNSFLITTIATVTFYELVS